jgi:hypothetical protein
MANGDSLHQPNVKEGAVVFGPTVYDVPLLPFEKELIATVGITEEEYREFVAEAKRRGAIRPAAYDHIPDIRAGEAATTAILVNLAISLVLTGAAYLLTPKPKMPGAKDAGGVVDLESLTGSQRFTPSRGFETLAELADYGSPIPLIFGLYRDGIGGGMLTTPKLVWSRMFSQGTMQRAKLMFIVGEQGDSSGGGIEKPDLEGVFLGNNALDVSFEDFFAFYWKKDSSTNTRITGSDKVYGTQGSPDRGAPDVNSKTPDVFTAPTPSNLNDTAFCHAYSPANNVQFGTYGGIANGTSYRVNYKVVSVPEDQDSKKAQAVLMLERMKIVGDFNQSGSAADTLREQGITPGNAAEDANKVKDILELNQQGIGRNYSPRMGIVRFKRGGVTQPLPDADKIFKTFESVSEGDEAIFIISPTQIPEDFYQRGDGRGPSVSDINAGVKALQSEADDAMQLGEKFEIGGMIWKVTKRKLVKFDPDGTTNQKIELLCIDASTSSGNKLGIVDENKVIAPSDDYVYIGDSGPGASRVSVGEAFYPITRVALATVRNNRMAVTTEFGIKSTVYQRLNGICNFMSLPSSVEIGNNDEDNIQYNTGTSTVNIKRSSVFRVFIRRINRDGTTEPFEAFPCYFVVTGQTPQARYNFLQFSITYPAQLEYKFVPCSGSDLRSHRTSYDFILLSASGTTDTTANGQNGVFTKTANLWLGPVTVRGGGTILSRSTAKEFISLNKEFVRDPKAITGGGSSSYPSVVRFEAARPDAEIRNEVAAIDRAKNIANSGVTYGKLGAFFYDILGDPDSSSYAVGHVERFNTVEYAGELRTKWVNIAWVVKKEKYTTSHYSGQKHQWKFQSFTVLGSGGNFAVGQTFDVMRGSKDTSTIGSDSDYPNSNPYKNGGPDGQVIRWSGFRFKVTAINANQEMPARSQAWRYEVFGAVTKKMAKNAEQSDPETVILQKDQGSKTLKVDLVSTAREFNNPIVGQQYGWTIPKVTKIYKDSDTTQNWVKDEKVAIFKNVSANNPFNTGFYSTVGQQYQIDAIGETLDPTLVDTSDKDSLVFAGQTQITDISFYRDLVEKSNSREPEHEIVYVNEIQENQNTPQMPNLVLAGLSLKASRNFTRLDQLRCWMGRGLAVKRLHPNKSVAYGDTAAYGPSNLFSDLVFFLLTDQTAGAGGLLGMQASQPYLVDTTTLGATSRFLERQKLFFNGPIVERTNLRRFITDAAPFFLCNFIITDGKFSLQPALPFNSGTGEFNTGAVQIDQLFTAGNILEDSYKLEYLGAEERRVFKAVVRFRQEQKNRLPEEKVINVKGVGGGGIFADESVTVLPQEQFDLTQFCTTEDHAFMVAKYFLALRAYVKHTISFSTTVEGLSIKAGSFIKVVTESSPYSAAQNGTVSASGAVTSVDDLPDGTYTVDYYKSGDEEIEGPVPMAISNGSVADSTFHDSVFTVRNASVSQNIYVVEQLTFSEEGTVDIVASEHPCDDQGRSLIVQTILNDNLFRKR